MAKHLILVAAALTITLGACASDRQAAGVAGDETPRDQTQTDRETTPSKTGLAGLKRMVSEDDEVLPIGLTKLLVEPASKESAAKLRGGFLLGAGCRINKEKYLPLDHRILDSDEADYRYTFERTLSEMGYATATGGTEIFAFSDEDTRIAYQVAAVLTYVDIDLCLEGNWWNGAYTWRAHGTGETQVAWQVYSNLDRKTVYSTITSGEVTLNEPTAGGARFLLQGAFREAARKLGEKPGFLRAVIYQEPGSASSRRSAEEDTKRYPEPIAIPRLPLFSQQLERHSEEVLEATVLIRPGGGHGSGFFVSEDGLILTNQHVVGSAEVVRILMHNGLMLDARVVRTDRRRDVALLRAPVSGAKALPIRRKALEVGEPVFAVGSPLKEQHKNTVTKGTVSAFRKDPLTGLSKIQADASIEKGNSGGPLVDARGNVVGITASSFVKRLEDLEVSTGINFFIPIRSALEHLEIALPPEPTS